MQYFIACYKNNRSIDTVLWWKPERCGYTTNLDIAGRYDADDDLIQAYIKRNQDGDYDNVPVPVDLALANAHSIVSADRQETFWSGEAAAMASEAFKQ